MTTELFSPGRLAARSPARSRHRSRLAWVVLAATVARPAFAAPVDSPQREEARQLVVAAAQTEISGDPARYLSLLNEALRVDPENEIARWHLGQVNLDGKWVVVEEAQRRSAADAVQKAYEQRRTSIDPSSITDLLALARWCRKAKLNDEAEFYWRTVLTKEPTNSEAIRALEMRWTETGLVTRDVFADEKRQAKAQKAAARHWEPTIAKWRRSVTGKDTTARNHALSEIRDLRQPNVIPSLENVTLGPAAQTGEDSANLSLIAGAFVDALGEMPDAAATESLVRHAVLAPRGSVRELATEQLRPRPQTDYVPLLLSGLSMPIESSFAVRTFADGSVHYSHQLYQVGQNADVVVDASHSTLQHSLPGRTLVRRQFGILEDRTETPAERARRIATNMQRTKFNYGTTAASIEARVDRENQAMQAMSSRIIPVLSSLTGKDFAAADQWWGWWQETNEYYAAEKPVNYQYYSDIDHNYYGLPYDTVSQAPSCFVKGTPVWTKTGQRPIETLAIGDLVLSQDVTSGRLAYKPIVGKTVRPPSAILKITLDGAEIKATKGHPFWVAGVGWRMAKELGDDALLHHIGGAARVQSVEQLPEAEAYNLVVDGFATYFVGEAGFLVHDNTPRKPTLAIVPGVSIATAEVSSTRE